MSFFKKILEWDEQSRRMVALACVILAGTIAFAIFGVYVNGIVRSSAPEAADEHVETHEFSFGTTLKRTAASAYRSASGALRNLFDISTSKTYEVKP